MALAGRLQAARSDAETREISARIRACIEKINRNAVSR